MVLVDVEQFERETDSMGRKIYVALREDRPVAHLAVEVACLLLDWGRETPAARQLIEVISGDLSAGEAEELAAKLLVDIGYDPGFALAPWRMENFRRALQGVQADFSEVRPAEGMRLRFDEEDYGAVARVSLRDDSVLGAGVGISASVGDNLTDSQIAIAEEVQDEIADRFLLVWPECPLHGLGVHPVESDSSAWWHCRADGGHVVARIGSVSTKRTTPA